MRHLRIALVLLSAVALTGCIFHTNRRHPDGHGGDSRSDGHSGGPPPGRGWKK